MWHVQDKLDAGRKSEKLTEEFFSRATKEAFASADEEFLVHRALYKLQTDAFFLRFNSTVKEMRPGDSKSTFAQKTAREELNMDGTTAICVFVWEDMYTSSTDNLKMLCANCGDSRAVLVKHNMKSGLTKGIPMSVDHKPDRDDERKRVHAAGGIVQDMTGVSRVFTPSPLQIGSFSMLNCFGAKAPLGVKVGDSPWLER